LRIIYNVILPNNDYYCEQKGKKRHAKICAKMKRLSAGLGVGPWCPNPWFSKEDIKMDLSNFVRARKGYN
jgi:hypothetical protein